MSARFRVQECGDFAAMLKQGGVSLPPSKLLLQNIH